MTNAELAWVAGLLEGEGTFQISQIKTYSGIQVICSMTDRDVIARLHRLCGGTLTVRPPQRVGWSIQYKWVLGTRPLVVALLKDLLPWMGQRRSARIQELLACHESHPIRRPIKGHTCKCQECKPYEQQQ